MAWSRPFGLCGRPGRSDCISDVSWSHPPESNRRPADYEVGIPQPHLRLHAAGLAGRRVQGVGEALVAGGQPMRVPAQCGAGIGVTELRADIDDGMAFGQISRGTRHTVSDLTETENGETRDIHNQAYLPKLSDNRRGHVRGE